MADPQYQHILHNLMETNKEEVMNSVMELQCKKSSLFGPLEPTGINQYNTIPRDVASLPFNDDIVSYSLKSELPVELQLITRTLERMALENMSNIQKLPTSPHLSMPQPVAMPAAMNGLAAAANRSSESLNDRIRSLNLPSVPLGGPNPGLDQLGPGLCSEWWWGIESGDAATSTDNPGPSKESVKKIESTDLSSNRKTTGATMKSRARARPRGAIRPSRIAQRAQHAYRRQVRHRTSRSDEGSLRDAKMASVSFILSSENDSDREEVSGRRMRSRSRSRMPNTHRKLGMKARSAAPRPLEKPRSQAVRRRRHSYRVAAVARRQRGYVSTDSEPEPRKRLHVAATARAAPKRRQRCRCPANVTRGKAQTRARVYH